MSHFKFIIVAHIDHGKSTLATNILNYCTAKKYDINIVDNLPIEKRRGITVRSTYLSFTWKNNLYHLIDTPGHVDFKYQLDLFLTCVNCVVLLIDITQGIQCQTINHYLTVKEHNLPYIIAVTKLDLLDDDLIHICLEEIANYFKIDIDEIYKINYNWSHAISGLLEKIVHKSQPINNIREIVILDLFKDKCKGWIFLIYSPIHVKADEILFINDIQFKVKKIYGYNGIIIDETIDAIFYIQSNYRGNIDYRYKFLSKIPFSNEPLILPNNVLWSVLYPTNTDIIKLKEAALFLHQNDYTFNYKVLPIGNLGHGLLGGFYGKLHREVIIDRLKEEYNIECQPTPPLIEYKVYLTNNTVILSLTPNDIDIDKIVYIQEPYIHIKLMFTPNFSDLICSIIKKYRGYIIKSEYISFTQLFVEGNIPLYFAINGLDDVLMRETKGYVNFVYGEITYITNDIKPLRFYAHNTELELCNTYAHRDDSVDIAEKTLSIIKKNISREQFNFTITGWFGNKIIKSLKIPQYRKDTLVKVTGLSRVKKVLERQKRGKKLLKAKGKVHTTNGDLIKWFWNL